jgi:quinoprotein glucose dehydrogenase
MAPRMLLAVSFFFALAGAGFAATAALLPDTGINGTGGAYLALLGAATLASTTGFLMTARFSKTTQTVLTVIAVLMAILTAVASWFLMQEVVVLLVIASGLALLVSRITAERSTI